MKWLDELLRRRAPRIYMLLHPTYPLNVAFAELKPGHYILVMRSDAISRAAFQRIGWPRFGEPDPGIRICKVLVHGDPKDVVALFRLGDAEIVGG